MDQFGWAERDQYNAARDVNITYNAVVDPTADLMADYDEETESDSTGNVVAAASGGGVAFLLVAAIVIYLIFGGDEVFPSTSDPWPSGVQKDAILAQVSDWIGTCQKSNAARPSNCPQALDDSSDSVSAITWAFYGGIAEAAEVRFDKSKNRFNILGAFVAVANYKVSKTVRKSAYPITYWARLDWNDGHPQVKEVVAYTTFGAPPVVKADPKPSWDDLSVKVREAFTACAAGTSKSLPAGCPEWQSAAPNSSKVKWSVSGDPLLTARPTFDSKFGVIHVKGSYELVASYKDSGSPKADSHAANYDAWVAMGSNGLEVLKIQDDA